MMKTTLVVAISCTVTWFVSKWSGGDQVVETPTIEARQEDTIMTQIAMRQKELTSAIESGDARVSQTIEQTANTIVTLKKEVNTLKNKIVELTNENNDLKKTISSFISGDSDKFKLLPIAEDHR